MDDKYCTGRDTARNGHSEVLDTRDGNSPPDPLHALSPCGGASAREPGRPYWLVQLEILDRCGLALNPTLGIRRALLAPPLNLITGSAHPRRREEEGGIDRHLPVLSVRRVCVQHAWGLGCGDGGAIRRTSTSSSERGGGGGSRSTRSKRGASGARFGGGRLVRQLLEQRRGRRRLAGPAGSSRFQFPSSLVKAPTRTTVQPGLHRSADSRSLTATWAARDGPGLAGAR